MPQCSAAGGGPSCGWRPGPGPPTIPRIPLPRVPRARPRAASWSQPAGPPRTAPPAFIRASRICPGDPCCPPPCTEPITFCPTLMCPKPTRQVCCQKGGSRFGGTRSSFLKLKPRIDKRIYRNGEHLCISFAGHIPGEMYIHGRNLPTTTTFAKRRLKTYTPYEFVDPDGCCSFP